MPKTKTPKTSRLSRTTAQSSAPTTRAAAKPQPLELNVLLLHPKNKKLNAVLVTFPHARDSDETRFSQLNPDICRECLTRFDVRLNVERIDYWLNRCEIWKAQPRSVDQNNFDESSLPPELRCMPALADCARVKKFLNLEQCNSNLIDLIVTGYDTEDEQSSVAPLPQLVRYGKLLGSNFTPSWRAQSRNRTVSQQDDSTALFDGSFVVDEQGKRTADRVAQPIEIFYPPFATVKQKLRDATLEPSPDILGLVYELMDSSRMIALEEQYEEEVLVKLSQVLQHATAEIVVEGGCRPDGQVWTDINGTMVTLIITELKQAMGEDGCNVLAQAAFSMLKAWSADRVKRYRENCTCPTFILAGGGPHLALLGGVWADRFIVQSLTDLVHIGYDSNKFYDDKVYKVARLFTVICDSLKDLAAHYKKLDKGWTQNPPPSLDFATKEVPLRFLPQCRQYFCRKREQTFNLRYIRPINESSSTNVAYIAMANDQYEVLVKFSDRYGYEAHEHLADKGLAPQLYYVGLLDGSAEHDVKQCVEARGTTRTERCGLYEGPVKMIVMEYLNGEDGWTKRKKLKWPRNAHEQVRDAVNALHQAGYVFGDLRPPNVVFTPKSDNAREFKACLIDFDWSGREGEVFYPPGMSKEAGWTKGVEPFKQIEKGHDLAMLDLHFKS